MSNIDSSVAAAILAKCGRHCCICRRFNPIRLQVHHIVLESEGGTGDPDNLIPICLTCHQDVHTKAPFTRRFTGEELKLHREQVFKLVAEGKLKSEDDVQTIVRLSTNSTFKEFANLSPEAASMLMEAATKGQMIDPEAYAGKLGHVFNREYAKNLEAFQQLCKKSYLRHFKGILYHVTHEGYLAADQLLTLSNSEESK